MLSKSWKCWRGGGYEKTAAGLPTHHYIKRRPFCKEQDKMIMQKCSKVMLFPLFFKLSTSALSNTTASEDLSPTSSIYQNRGFGRFHSYVLLTEEKATRSLRFELTNPKTVKCLPKFQGPQTKRRWKSHTLLINSGNRMGQNRLSLGLCQVTHGIQ